MKIRKLRFDNHYLFGSVVLDFTDDQGRAIDTIIIAGENGVGKSVLLDAIFEFSKGTISREKSNEKRIIEIELSDADFELFNSSKRLSHFSELGLKTNILNIEMDFSITDSWNQFKIVPVMQGTVLTVNGDAYGDPVFRRIIKMIFSDVEINFSPKSIQSVTSKNIDNENFISERSGANLSTEITQLLIDIQNSDALDFIEWARNNKGDVIDDQKIDIRTRRFTSAFDFMFPTKKYKGIQNVKNYKQVFFEENGKEMIIDDLSSGEKQIVFRGSFLLKDKESAKGSIILIDEPELSLHPNWQLKILNYFKKLFTDSNGIQTSQLFIATHSPFIIHNSNRNADKVIVLQKDEFGKINIPATPKYYGWSTEKIIQSAFNISQFTKIDKVIVFVEGETDEKYFRKCFEIFDHNDKNIEFTWIGRVNENGAVENSGDTALNQARTFLLANKDMVTRKIVLLYDNDTNKPEENYGNLLVRVMQKNNDNGIFKIGVENLLKIPIDFDYDVHYKTKSKTDGYGAESIIKELDKQALCGEICERMILEKQKEVLTNLNSLIMKIYGEVNK